MANVKDQELQALDQIKAIVERLGPDSYIGTAIRNAYEGIEEPTSDAAEVPVRLPEKTVREWEEAADREALQRRLSEAEVEVLRLKAQLYDLNAGS